jgi:hypothetical protein
MGSPAKLAAIPLSLVHNAILVLSTGVGQFLSYCTLEKSLQTTELDIVGTQGSEKIFPAVNIRPRK